MSERLPAPFESSSTIAGDRHTGGCLSGEKLAPRSQVQACRLARGSQDEEGSRGVGRGECLLLARPCTRSPGLGAGERRPHPRRGPVTLSRLLWCGPGLDARATESSFS